MVIIDTVINTLFGGLTLDPAGMHCPWWDDAFVSSCYYTARYDNISNDWSILVFMWIGARVSHYSLSAPPHLMASFQDNLAKLVPGQTTLDFNAATVTETAVVQTVTLRYAKLQSDHQYQHLVIYRLDALPVMQPTVSKHWRQIICLLTACEGGNILTNQNVILADHVTIHNTTPCLKKCCLFNLI